MAASGESRFSRSVLIPGLAKKAQLRELLRSHAHPPDHLLSTISALLAELQRYSKMDVQSDSVKADRESLQEYFDDCRSLLSPIRRLPSEILTDIFGYCASFLPIWDEIGPLAELSTELSRVAQAPLLAVSQVCARWHSIAMYTPSLWTTIELDGVLWETLESMEKTRSLVAAALARTGTCLLHVDIMCRKTPAPGPVLELLVAQSERWKKVVLSADEDDDLAGLRPAKGRLSRLETLWIYGTVPLDVFIDAPHLTGIEWHTCISDVTRRLVTLPLNQMRRVWFEGSIQERTAPEEAIPVLSLLPRLAHGTTAFIVLLRLEGDELATIDDNTFLPPVTSTITTLALGTEVGVDGFLPSELGQLISGVFGCLTLPYLEMLYLYTAQFPHVVVPWLPTAFSKLSDRSSFPTHLKCLQLCQVRVTETELLECLSTLPMLESLSIADHRVVDGGGVDHHLITDHLLSRLTAPSLIPRLRSFGIRSVLRFDDNLYLAFLLSRLEGQLWGTKPFRSRIRWFPGHRRDLDAGVAARITELCSQRKLTFRMREED